VIALIEDAGFIYGSYAVTFAVVGAFAWRVARHGRRLGRQIDDDEKYWT
jgi:heme exporter protein CcmD